MKCDCQYFEWSYFPADMAASFSAMSILSEAKYELARHLVKGSSGFAPGMEWYDTLQAYCIVRNAWAHLNRTATRVRVRKAELPVPRKQRGEPGGLDLLVLQGDDATAGPSTHGQSS